MGRKRIKPLLFVTLMIAILFIATTVAANVNAPSDKWSKYCPGYVVTQPMESGIKVTCYEDVSPYPVPATPTTSPYDPPDR